MKTNRRLFKNMTEYEIHKICLENRKLIENPNVIIKDEVLINSVVFVIVILGSLSFIFL